MAIFLFQKGGACPTSPPTLLRLARGAPPFRRRRARCACSASLLACRTGGYGALFALHGRALRRGLRDYGDSALFASHKRALHRGGDKCSVTVTRIFSPLSRIYYSP